MLNLFRRHTKRCPHDSRESLRCQCPIWIDWTTDRQRIRKPLGLRDWQAAQRRARDIEADGLTATKERITVKTAIEQFLKDTQNHTEPSTLRQYRNLTQRLNEFCQQRGYVFLGQLGVVEIREFRNSWKVSPRTAQKHLGNLKRLFNWRVENQWLDKSPAKPLKSPNVGDSDVVPFTEGEIEKILEVCGQYKGSNKPRLVLLTELMLSTGLRIGDAVTKHRTRFIKKSDGWSVELRTAKTGLRCPARYRIRWRQRLSA
jgi:integrase